MSRLIATLVAPILASLFLAGPVFAQSADAACEAKAVDKNGKPLVGAAKSSFMKKCHGDAVNMECSAKALDKNGKPLAGAAKNSFMKKCQADMKAAK